MRAGCCLIFLPASSNFWKRWRDGMAAPWVKLLSPRLSTRDFAITFIRCSMWLPPISDATCGKRSALKTKSKERNHAYSDDPSAALLSCRPDERTQAERHAFQAAC